MSHSEGRFSEHQENSQSGSSSVLIEGSTTATSEQESQRLAAALRQFFDHLTSRRLFSIPRHKYSTLKGDEIRILDVLPARHSGAPYLQGHIRTIRLTTQHRPNWECVSYTWGAPIMDHDVIILDEGSDRIIGRVPITQRLHGCISHLRYENGSRSLWIDQICIDQRNITERGKQVQMMKQIYASAERALVWLGEPESEDDLARLEETIQALKSMTLSEEKLSDKIPELREEYPRMTSNRRSQLNLAQEKHDIKAFSHHAPSDMVPPAIQFEPNKWQKAAMGLFKSGWSTRAWIVQEFIVPAEIIVHYGPLTMSDSTFIRLISVLRMGLLVNHVGFTFLSYHRNYWQERGTIGTTFDRGSANDPDFITLLHQMQWNTQASDPRDKIFAFIALKGSDMVPHITPDYEQSPRDVFTDAALAIIRDTGSLDILALSHSYHIAKPKFQIPNLPSWVPNWHDSTTCIVPFRFPGDLALFQSARAYPHRHTVANGSGKLIAMGKEVATITEMYVTDFRRSDSLADFAIDFDSLLMEMEVPSSDVKKQYTILRTLLADGRYSPMHPIPHDMSRIYDIISSPYGIRDRFPTEYDTPAFQAFLNDIHNCLGAVRDRNLFEADGIGGRAFGLCDQYFERGDVVCILHGSAVPVVLREVPEDMSTDGSWIVVGQCYLDGWMYGDYPLPEFWDEFENSPRTFVLV